MRTKHGNQAQLQRRGPHGGPYILKRWATHGSPPQDLHCLFRSTVSGRCIVAGSVPRLRPLTVRRCEPVDTATHEKWLADTRKFWDADSEFVARYRRICLSPEIDATDDEYRLKQLWDQETDAAIPRILLGVPMEADWTCLEIGCGIGRLMMPLSQRCRRVIGVDLSSRMIRWAKAYLARCPNVELIVNDGRSLEGVADGSVDFVFSHLAFQHITLFEVVENYLDEIVRVLRPGGYCRIQNWRDAHKPIGESFKDMIRPLLGRGKYRSSRCWTWADGKEIKFGGVVFHPRVWRKLLHRHGLDVIDMEVGAGHDFWMWTTSRRRMMNDE